MSAVQIHLLGCLRELEAAVSQMATAYPKPNLMAMFEKIDQLTKSLPRDTDPTLLHYLHKRSYLKARLFLEGRESENKAGNCGHVE